MKPLSKEYGVWISFLTGKVIESNNKEARESPIESVWIDNEAKEQWVKTSVTSEYKKKKLSEEPRDDE